MHLFQFADYGGNHAAYFKRVFSGVVMRIILDIFDYEINDLKQLSLSLLKRIARHFDIDGFQYLNKNKLIDSLYEYIKTNRRYLLFVDEDGIMSGLNWYNKEARRMLENNDITMNNTPITNNPADFKDGYYADRSNDVPQDNSVADSDMSRDSDTYSDRSRDRIKIDSRSFDIDEDSFGLGDKISDFNKSDQRQPRRNFSDCNDIVAARKAIRSGELREYRGILEINAKGYGFLRGNFCGNDNDKDAFVDNMIIKYLSLKDGDYIVGAGKKNEEGKSASLTYITAVNDINSEELPRRVPFEQLTPIFPDERLKLEAVMGRSEIAIRCIDLIAPIGKGQRAIIVSPPKAGKTTLLKQIANSIINNNPEVKVFMLLVDERPEEVTDMQRSIKAEVVYSTFDENPEHHIATAESVLKCAKRYVEYGKDVVIMLDSITRLARAYNVTIEHSGRALSGGLDPSALSAPKRFFGSARNVENGGSLTIIATALVDTGSRLDDVIFEEFKGTGNMEVVLDRKLSERRIFPAIDLAKSSTRRDDLLLEEDELRAAQFMRGMLDNSNYEVLDGLINEIYNSKNNAEFLKKFNARMEMMNKKGYVMRK